MTEETWETRAQWPLTALAVAFLLAWSWPILDPGLAPAARTACQLVQWTAWAVFALDYLVRLALTEDRGRFVRGNVLDLIIIILPLLRPLRLLRLVTLLRVVNRTATTSLRGRVIAYVAGGSVLLAYVAALAVLDAERGHPDANITTVSDALWWAAATMTTVGYGDRFPVTGTGRLVAGGLMLGGIALLGTVTATLASWLTDKVTEQTDATLGAQLDDLHREVIALRETLDRLTPEVPDRG